jgi:hypothetical protein
VFGGGVGGAAAEDLDPGAGGGVDDRATMLEQQRDLVLQAEEDAAEVDGDDPIPFLLGNLGGRLGLLLGACVVECVVEASERLDRLVKCGLYVLARVTSQWTAIA